MSRFRGPRRVGSARLLLAALAVSAAVPGLWATLAPRGFFDDFPGAGAWVAALPPFNEHLIRDVGAFYLAFALLLGWAAARPAWTLVVAVLAAWMLFGVLHLAFHVTHLGGFTTGAAVAQTAALGLVLVAAGAVLWLVR